ncbi:MAG: lipopolysaccharide biosynthesis protein, partial [Burkholderiales bacterium]|nr:lipopolysaccharide biosynthesis protein [Burkholderiales bacterium]
TEPQQRRLYFEQQVKETQKNLDAAQRALQDSGFGASVIKIDPKAAADSYAKLQADVTAATVRLQTLRGTLADGAPEIRQQQARLRALQTQLAQMSGMAAASPSQDYVGKYREFKYQESLLELLTRQYDMARVDEAREAPLIQVIDVATVPERRSKPRRLYFTAGFGIGALMLMLLSLYARDNWRRARALSEERAVRRRAAAG